MINTHGPSKEFKERILAECKRLTESGKHVEASYLYRTYFPEEEKLGYDC
jgi:hypothetical protein|tara:strand:+ start:6957 stop:7106 length:150 start_codon:yes stop_codon:yes gene_type:complete